MPRLTILFMAALVTHYSTKAYINHWAKRPCAYVRQLAFRKFAATPEKDALIESIAIALKNEVTRTYHEIYVLQFDGGSRGNPGIAGSGSVLYRSQVITDSNKDDKNEKGELTGSEEVWYGHHYIGDRATNNVAEYTGLIEGLKQAVAMNLPAILIQGDSQLIIRQVQGVYKVKNEELKKLHATARKLLDSIPSYSLEYIPRAQNGRADELSNFAMDSRQDVSVLIPQQVALTLGGTDTDTESEEKVLILSEEDKSAINTAATRLSVEGLVEKLKPRVEKEGKPKREEKTKFTFENIEIFMDQNEVGDDLMISVVEVEGKSSVKKKSLNEKQSFAPRIVKIIIVREKQCSTTSPSNEDDNIGAVVKDAVEGKVSPKKGPIQPKKLYLNGGRESVALSNAKLRKELSASAPTIELTETDRVEAAKPPKEPRKKKIQIIT